MIPPSPCRARRAWAASSSKASATEGGRLKPGKGIKGLKAKLPTKWCAACGRVMAWRKAWAKNWDAVRYCSERCRRHKGAGPATPAS